MNIQVSAFKNVYQTKPQTINLHNWLKGHPTYNDQIIVLRNTADKARRNELKKELPCMIPTGIYSAPNDQSLISFSRLISFDFDSVNDLHGMKAEITRNPHVCYCGLSASGNGLFALIKVTPAAKAHYRQYYAALINEFGEASAFVDKKCSNISRKRFYSYDPNAVFNYQATEFTIPENELSKPEPCYHFSTVNGHASDSKFDLLINAIEQQQADITTDYKDWISIGGALANLMGENGRSYFHRISQFYPGYKSKDVDKQFSRALKRPPNFGEGIIFGIAKRHNVILKNRG